MIKRGVTISLIFLVFTLLSLSVVAYDIDVDEESHESEESFETLSIKLDALRVANEINEYIQANPGKTLGDLQEEQVFRDIAIQRIGKTGYTALVDSETSVIAIHINKDFQGIDSHIFEDTLPELWAMIEKTIGTTCQDTYGYYDWKEPDGLIKRKYAYQACIDTATADGKKFYVTATTYPDEYGQEGIIPEPNIITLASGEWAPYVSENLQYEGVVSRIVSEAFASQGVDVDYAYLQWSNSMDQAREGVYHGTLPWLKNEERLQDFYFSDSIAEENVVFFHKKDLDFEWDSISDLSGYKIGGTRGYFYGDDFDEAEKQGLISIERAPSDAANFEKLIAGEVDIIIAEIDVGYNLVYDLFGKDDRENITHYPKSISASSLYLLLSKKIPENEQHIIAFNRGLKELGQEKIDQYWEESRTGAYAKYEIISAPVSIIISETNIDVISEKINSQIAFLEKDLLFLKDLPNFNMLINGDISVKANVAQLMSTLSKNKKIFYQIRYIDETGMEVIRADYIDGDTTIIPEDQLQNKKGRYYFDDAHALSEGEIFVSPLDLNIEDGEIENRGSERNPVYVPIIRYATPVFDDDNNKKGIIILNIYADAILDIIEKEQASSGSQIYMVNKEGYFLFHPDKSKEFGFMFENNVTILNELGPEFHKIFLDDEGELIKEDIAYKYKKIFYSDSEEDFWVLVVESKEKDSPTLLQLPFWIYTLIGVLILLILFLIYRGRYIQEKTKVRTFSIRKKLIFAFLIIALVIGVMGYILIIQNQNTLEASVGLNSVVISQETIDKIDRTIYSRIEQLRAYSANLINNDDLLESNSNFERLENIQNYINKKDIEWISAPKKEITPFMRDILDNKLSKKLREELELEEFYRERYGYQVYGEIFVTNKYGANVAQTRKTSDYYQADEEWWQTAKEQGLYVGDVGYDESADIYSTDIGIRIDDKDGNFLGVMKVVLNIEETFKIIDDIKYASSYETINLEFLSGDGRLIYKTADYNILEEFEDWALLQLKNQDTELDYLILQEPDEEEELLAFAFSKGHEDYEGLGWALVIEYETEDIFSPIVKARNLIILISFIVIMFSFVVGFFISRSITDPIKRLHSATLKMEKGDFGVKIDIKTGDELEELGTALNTTTKALGKLEEDRKNIDKAKTEFLSITSHELRSPMTPMRAQLQMLNSEYFGKLNEKQKKAVEIVLRNTTRLDDIIVDFLEISRIEAARMKFDFISTNLVEPITNLVEEMKGFMPEKNINLVLNMGKLPKIRNDPNRTMQVLRNLVNNAMKFSPENSTITINVKHQKDHILISVKDKGIGISVENQRKVFEPFFQEEQTIYRKYGGTGLGLAICRGIVESQNGEMWVESKKGQGSTFYFTVPFVPVEDIQPINLLFSPTENIDMKVKDIFKDILGPLGESEFNELKTKNQMIKDKLFKYMNSLFQQGIVSKEDIDEFKKRISLLYPVGKKN